MPNDYFQFKQFRVEQGSCAMKVSTDACLLGAAANLSGATRVLDIGTGTGLLALMAAQRHPTACIEAVEIDAAAAAQAAANAAASTWAGRIQVVNLSLKEYAQTSPAAFSHIICNPPFFGSAWPSADVARRTARHVSEASLSYEELADYARQLLLPDGTLTVLLPPPEMVRFGDVAQSQGLVLASRLVVRHRPAGRVTRHICAYSTGTKAATEAELVIYAGTGPEYSPGFKALLGDFYLAL